MKHQIQARGVLRWAAVALSFAACASAQSTFVPAVIQPPAGNEEYLRAAAAGTQNYLCLPAGWTFVGPQATLMAKLGWVRLQVATHFLSPNPDEGGVARATWQNSLDTSAVWAQAIASSTDAGAGPSAIPWLLLQVVGSEQGPNGGAALSETTYIQRINTTGGLAPTTACTVGARTFVPYTADYVFFRKSGH